MVWPEWQMKNEDLMDGRIIRHNIIIRHLSSEQPKFISIRNIIGSSTLPLNSFIPLEHNAWHLSDIYFKWLRRKINVWRINYLISTLYQQFPWKMCRDFSIFSRAQVRFAYLSENTEQAAFPDFSRQRWVLNSGWTVWAVCWRMSRVLMVQNAEDGIDWLRLRRPHPRDRADGT